MVGEQRVELGRAVAQAVGRIDDNHVGRPELSKPSRPLDGFGGRVTPEPQAFAFRPASMNLKSRLGPA